MHYGRKESGCLERLSDGQGEIVLLCEEDTREDTNDHGLQYPFRLAALAGEIPGVKKASW